MVFIHDDRSYGTESLWTDELGKYQGMWDGEVVAQWNSVPIFGSGESWFQSHCSVMLM